MPIWNYGSWNLEKNGFEGKNNFRKANTTLRIYYAYKNSFGKLYSV